MFGSGGRDELRPDSHLDLAVLLDQGTPVDLPEFWRELSTVLDTERFDLLILNDAEPFLAHRTLQGRVLFCREPDTLTAFKVRSFKRYEDFLAGQAIRRIYRRKRLLGQGSAREAAG